MDSRVIKLTPAAHKHGNLNLSSCGKDFFPPDVFGPSSRTKGLGVLITLKANGLPNPIKTDIPTDKKTGKPRWIFRKRSWVRNFVRCHKLIPGDTVTIRRLSTKNYELIPNLRKLKFIDLFAGIGGFRLSFEKAGYECVFSSEIDANCSKVYFNNFGEIPCGDITHIPLRSIPYFDVLVAGFPCQPFSISGKKLGFNDTRGTLFFEICRIIQDKSPNVVLLENVKHMIYHDKGKTLRVILNSLIELGYKVDYEILNSNNFGVPQHRERIFIIGSKKGCFNFKKLRKKQTPKLRDFLSKNGDYEILQKSEYTMIKEPRTQESGLIFVGYRNKNTWKVGVRPNTEHLSRVHRQPNRIYSIEGVHPTIPSQEPSGRFFIYNPDKNIVRKLTLNECYRIMGFPDTFIKHPSPGVAYNQIGNSVCIPLCNEIAHLIKQPEGFVNEPQGKIKRDLQCVLFD